MRATLTFFVHSATAQSLIIIPLTKAYTHLIPEKPQEQEKVLFFVFHVAVASHTII